MKDQKKKFNYFNAFLEMAKHAKSAAQLLDNVLNNYNLAENFEQRRNDMRDIEHACDEVMYEIMNHIVRDFITPIEREDIILIGQSLDNVTDAIDDIFMVMYMYHVSELRRETLDFTELLIRLTQSLERMAEEFTYFRKSRHLKERIIEISDLEKIGDDLYVKSLYNLFGEEGLTGRDLIIWRDIFTRLEACCDAIEGVGQSMETVLLKNS